MLFSHVRTSSWFDLLLFTNWIELFENGYICLPFYAKSWQNYSRNLLDCMWVGILSHFPDFLIILISIIITNVFTIVLSCQSRLPFFFFLLAFITFLFFFLSFFLSFFFFWTRVVYCSHFFSLLLFSDSFFHVTIWWCWLPALSFSQVRLILVTRRQRRKAELLMLLKKPKCSTASSNEAQIL